MKQSVLCQSGDRLTYELTDLGFSRPIQSSNQPLVDPNVLLKKRTASVGHSYNGCNPAKLKPRQESMTPRQLAQLDDEQLLELAKQNKPSPLFDAFFIGFLIGIMVFRIRDQRMVLAGNNPIVFDPAAPPQTKKNPAFASRVRQAKALSGPVKITPAAR